MANQIDDIHIFDSFILCNFSGILKGFDGVWKRTREGVNPSHYNGSREMIF
jgi:hypothetical protein